MKTEQENKLKKQIKEYSKQIHDLDDKLKLARQQLTELQSEFQVGDWVTFEGSKNSAVYVLTAIRPGYSDTPRYFGQKIKKDGTPGARISELFVWGNQRLVKVT